MKLHLLSKFNIFKTVSQCKLFQKYSTTAEIEQTNSTETLLQDKKGKDKVLFTPALTSNTVQALSDIASVTVATNNVSWAKISIPNFTLLEWNSYTLPSKFKNMDDENILALANIIRQSIPNSDMYVVESCPFKALVFKEHILRTALIVLLNFLNKDVELPSKVVFQKPVILNTLCNIVVGSERISASWMVKNIFKLCKSWKNESQENCRTPECFSLVNIDEEQKQNFLYSDLAKQESLSLALLIVLTFSELNIIQNSESICQIQNKIQTKSKKVLTKNHSSY